MLSKRNCMILWAVCVLLISIPITVLAKGAVKFPVASALLVDGKEIQPGNCELKWSSDSSQTEVTFINNKQVVATVQGKIVNVDRAFLNDALVTEPNASGQVILKEVRLQGKKFKIVFE
jgi:hypothetical protein